MTQPCIVAFCKNIGTHRLPSDETRRTQWLQAIVNLKPGLSVRKYSRICSAHFKNTDFNKTTLSLLQSDGIIPKTLKKTAIPTIFPWKTTHEESPSTSKRLEEQTFAFIPPNKTYARIPPINFVEEQPYLNTMMTCEYSENDPLQLSTKNVPCDFNEEEPLNFSNVHADSNLDGNSYDTGGSVVMEMKVNIAEEIKIPLKTELQEKSMFETKFEDKTVQTQ